MSVEGQTTVVNTTEPIAPKATDVQAQQAQDVKAQQAQDPKLDTANQDPKEGSDLSAKFAALAKKERLARQALQRVKQLETQIAEREKRLNDQERFWDEFKKEPLKALSSRGFTYEDLTKAALNDGKFEPSVELRAVNERIDRLTREQLEREKKNQELIKARENAQLQQTIDTFKENINSHVESNKEKYELTNLYDAQDLVYQTVEEHFSRTKKVLSLDEACDLVEQYLENELERTAANSKKFRSKYMTASPKQETRAPSRSSTTLTNDLIPSSAAPSMLPAKTESDRIRRALAALEGASVK